MNAHNQVRDLRAGKPRADALRELAARMDMPAVASFVSTLIQAEATGMSLGPILRAQAGQRRTERFARAGVILKIVPHLVSWRAAARAGARQTLELAAGEARRLGLAEGVALADGLSPCPPELAP